jgi:hypothetical protein
MRRSFALLFLAPLLAAAGAKAPAEKPAALTAKEIKDGWLSLFDGESTFGWVIEGEAKVDKGVLILGGKKPTRARVSIELRYFDVDFHGDVVGKGTVELFPGITYQQSTNIRMKHKEPGHATAPLAPFDLSIPADTQVILRRARVRPRELRPLFNGKDLTGWKVFKGDPKREKSKFTVTKEGWLNVKNGPGDLQTTEQFDDFILRLECISNGKYLNSGVFFRCLPNQYQQGYEAQIHNRFTDKPSKKYKIEEYDPKTHKLLGKKEVEYAAVDYGTGAIYNRIPARRGVARDGEWFTMTVAARGRHIATWVNGVQVVDWTDNRPANDNARKGYRAAAGAISIQGHDPTTDLGFRDIVIAELPRAKK